MKKYFALPLIALTIFTTACNENQPIIDSSNIAISADTQKRYNVDKIGNIIAETAAHRGWSVNKTGAGVIKANVKRKELQVAIIIHYSKSSYSITPDTSVQSDTRLYNRYVAGLRKDVDKRLSMAAYQ